MSDWNARLDAEIGEIIAATHRQAEDQTARTAQGNEALRAASEHYLRTLIELMAISEDPVMRAMIGDLRDNLPAVGERLGDFLIVLARDHDADPLLSWSALGFGVLMLLNNRDLSIVSIATAFVAGYRAGRGA